MPILGAVGELQFEVVLARLKDEYGVDATARTLSVSVARKVTWSDASEPLRWPRQTVLARDDAGELVALFQSERELELFERNNASAQLEPV